MQSSPYLWQESKQSFLSVRMLKLAFANAEFCSANQNQIDIESQFLVVNRALFYLEKAVKHIISRLNLPRKIPTLL